MFAQSSSIVGGVALARDCYHASQVAVRTTYLSRQDLETSNDAIIYGNLNNRDIAATYVNRGNLWLMSKQYYELALATVPDWSVALEKLDRVKLKIEKLAK
ncbi:MAG: hypothetical protein KTR16_04170 [Acidiferrobacterales bacterium]|nr:hypothetical protein [Acidiferrobacterales bacterium]